MTNDETPFQVERIAGKGPAVFVCDHASNNIPGRFGALGLDAAARASHIAWDPGALGVARVMSRRLDGPLVFATVSRLVVDLNRALDSPTLMPAVSAEVEIPANKTLMPGEREARLAQIYRPYHVAVDDLVATATSARRERGEPAPMVVAVHTFTPVYCGQKRPWQLGILFGDDKRLGQSLLTEIGRTSGLAVAANQPYSPADGVYWTLDQHAVARGLLNVMIEIRNDEVADEPTQNAWGERLADALARSYASLLSASRVQRPGETFLGATNGEGGLGDVRRAHTH